MEKEIDLVEEEETMGKEETPMEFSMKSIIGLTRSDTMKVM